MSPRYPPRSPQVSPGAPGPDLLDEVDAGLEVQAEVDEGPLDALQLVLLLLQHEHVVVEELLQLLVGEVDTQLLKVVELERERDKIQYMSVRLSVCLSVCRSVILSVCLSVFLLLSLYQSLLTVASR